jgi:hypothetical protein
MAAMSGVGISTLGIMKLLVKLGLVMILGGAAEAGSDRFGVVRVPLSGGGGGGGSAGGGAILTA